MAAIFLLKNKFFFQAIMKIFKSQFRPVGEGGQCTCSVCSLLLPFLGALGSIFYGTSCCSGCFRSKNAFLSSFLGVYRKYGCISSKITQFPIFSKVRPKKPIIYTFVRHNHRKGCKITIQRHIGHYSHFYQPKF